jgi:hypothetical protein
VPEFGRYDDLLCLLDTPAKQAALDFIKAQFAADMAALAEDKAVSLLGKWLPSINAHNADTVRHGKMVARGLGLTEAEYRKALSRLRAKIAIIENNLREKDYTFDYAKQPAKAMMKYRAAFLRHDGPRYLDFLDRVERGEAALHPGTLLPYEIIHSAVARKGHISAEEIRSMDVTWQAQPDYTGGENALVVVDGSGSMYGGYNSPLPASIALSLGIYFAERNQGAFHNHFITFSESPQLVEIKGANIYEKVRYAASFNEVANTNIEKVFELILSAAVENHVPQSELPATVYVISDMEFDYCARGAKVTNFENAKALFAEQGYTLPALVFWNVASRNRQQPVTMNESGAALVSGCSPRIFSLVTAGILSPYAFMLETLGAERYARVAA